MRTFPQLPLAGLAVVGLGIGAGCESPASATAYFQIPREGVAQEFYALPFPNDLRRDDAGHPVMDGYPRPVEIVNRYIDAIESLDGFGTNGAVIARFSGAIDDGDLPTPAAAQDDPTAAVYLVDIDPASPRRGERIPLRFRFQSYAGWTIGDNWLSALPFPGFPLAEHTTYALVITDRLHAAGGGALEPDVDWLAVREPIAPAGADPAVTRARTRYAPLFAWLDEPGGDERADVVSAAVFTTQTVTRIMGDLRARVWQLPAPTARDVVELSPNADFIAFDGMYDAPNFQTGTVPYASESDGGDIVYGEDGLPAVQVTEVLRFSFTIPKGPMPATGWPVALYAHGTGGDYHSYIGDRTANRLALEGIATFSIDQVLHGPRNPGGDPEINFFNFTNPLSARNNAIQGAVDDFSLLRLALGLRYEPGKGSQVMYPEVRFDPERVYFFGHSQGGATGPPFIAYEPLIKGAVLSGAGGDLYYALLNKTEPVDITSVVSSVVLDNPLDEFNPVLTLLQTWIERSDTINYGPLLARTPPPRPDRSNETMAPKAIYQSMGIIDHFTPVPNIEALAVAIGGNLVGPVLEPVEGLALRGREVLTAPVQDNVGTTTAVLAEYQAQGGDGHFVVFNVPAARKQSAEFLGTLARTGTATLVTP